MEARTTKTKTMETRIINATLTITLLSDCLPGSGAGVGAYIDTDSVFDRYGFPEIPGRRLKGCLRETAQRLLAMGYTDYSQEGVCALFGNESCEGSFLIGNAQVKDVQELRRAVEYYRSVCKKEQVFLLQPEAIADFYTNIHTRTAIDENGVARDHSLRTVRALRKNTVFTCSVSFPEEAKNFVALCAKALRHIGTNRNRGFGCVRIELHLPDDADYARQQEEDVSRPQDAPSSCGCAELILRLRTPVITGENHIPGVMLRGALAAVYMKKMPAPGDYGDDDDFRAMFLEKLRYEPALPTDGAYTPYRVVPASVVRYKVPEKDAPEYVDLAACEHPGVQTKGLASGSVYASGDEAHSMYMLRAARSRQMHHSMSGDLFSYDALEANGLFRARISGDPGSLACLLRLIHEGDELRLGKSRGAQYGCAVIEHIAPVEPEGNTGSSTRFVMTLQTPSILRDDAGTPTADGLSLLRALEKKTGQSLVMNRCFAVSGSIEGYNPQWRLSKQAVPALLSSTTIVFDAAQSASLPSKISLPREIWLGERGQEGYGLAYIETLDERTKHSCFDSEKPDMHPKSEEDKKKQDKEKERLGDKWDAFLMDFKQRYIREQLRLHAVQNLAETEKIPISISWYNGSVTLASRTLQDLFTLIPQRDSFHSLLASIKTIKDEKKKEGCLVLCKEDIQTGFEKAAAALLKDCCPSLDLTAADITQDWELHRFYLSECLRNAIIERNRTNRKEPK